MRMKKISCSLKPAVAYVDDVSRVSIIGFSKKIDTLNKGVLCYDINGHVFGTAMVEGTPVADKEPPEVPPSLQPEDHVGADIQTFIINNKDAYDFYEFESMYQLLKWMISDGKEI